MSNTDIVKFVYQPKSEQIYLYQYSTYTKVARERERARSRERWREMKYWFRVWWSIYHLISLFFIFLFYMRCIFSSDVSQSKIPDKKEHDLISLARNASPLIGRNFLLPDLEYLNLIFRVHADFTLNCFQPYVTLTLWPIYSPSINFQSVFFFIFFFSLFFSNSLRTYTLLDDFSFRIRDDG